MVRFHLTRTLLCLHLCFASLVKTRLYRCVCCQIIYMKKLRSPVCIGNLTISSAVWNKQARAKFSKANTGECNFVVFEEIYKWLFIPNCTRKIMSFLNNIHENFGLVKQKQGIRLTQNCAISCTIQGTHLIGYLWLCLLIDQSECLVYSFFFCSELPPFC